MECCGMLEIKFCLFLVKGDFKFSLFIECIGDIGYRLFKIYLECEYFLKYIIILCKYWYVIFMCVFNWILNK